MQIDQLIHQSFADVADIAKALESGQARSPCYDHVVGVREISESKTLSAVLLCFNGEFFTAFTRTLVSECPAGWVPSELVVNHDSHGVKHGSDTPGFEDSPALSSLQTRGSQIVPGDATHISAPSVIAPARLLVANPVKLLALDLAEFNRLMISSNLLIIAAPVDYSLTDEDRAVMVQLLRHVRYLSVLALPPSGQNVGAKPWHQEPIPAHVKTLPPFKLGDGALPDYLADSACLQRVHMLKSMVFQTLKQSVDLVGEQIEDRLHYLECCEAGDDFTLALLEHDPDVTAKVERNRQVIEDLADQLSLYSKHLQEESKHSLVGKGIFHLMVENELEALQPDDIEKEAVHTVVRLSISPRR